MSTAELRQLAKTTLDNLQPEQLKVAAESLRYLDERASEAATQELLKIPGLLEDLAEAELDIAEGRTVNWRDLRDGV